ncbi:MAG: hypothetical protein QRY71_00075 [Candidatus Rhabdochlamydia sp.]
MTIRSRSSSHENLLLSEGSKENPSLENALHASSVKKIKSASIEAFQTGEENISQGSALVQKDRDYALMNDPDTLIIKIRHITTERWIKAIDDEPNNGILVFNYGRMHPFLTRDYGKERDLNYQDCIYELLNRSDTLHRYVCMEQEEIFKEAAKRDFQGKCIYKQLAKEYQFINYTVLEEFTYPNGYQGTLSVTKEVDNFLKLIELYPNDDMNYALLGKVVRYYLMLNERLEDPGEKDWVEKKVFSLPGINKEEDLYLKALELNPYNDEAYVGLGLIKIARHHREVTDLFLKAFQMNPSNLEAAILHLDEVEKFSIHRDERNRFLSRRGGEQSVQDETIQFSDDTITTTCIAIEKAISSAAHYLVTAPHWDSWYRLETIDKSKKYLSIILKNFIVSSLEKHIKRQALQCFMYAQECSYDSQNIKKIANILLLISRTHLVDPDEDLRWIRYFCYDFAECYPVSIHMASAFAEFLKAHFPHDEIHVKKLISSFTEIINDNNKHSPFAYYHLATLISSHETLEIKGQKFTQLELYKKAAWGVYDKIYNAQGKQWTLDTAIQVLGHYAQTLEEDEAERDQQDFLSLKGEKASPMTKKNIYLKILSLGHQSAWTYFYLGTMFKNPLEIGGKRFNSPKELFLMALDLDAYHKETYYHLGHLVSLEKSITLLNGATFTPQQLYTRAIQLGIQKADAYFKAANLMKEGQAILLFDRVTYLSKIDLLFKAFSIDMESSYYLNQIALHLKKQKSVRSMTIE